MTTGRFFRYGAEFQDEDDGILPGAVRSASGQQLTISSGAGAILLASALTLAANMGITMVAGTGVADFSNGTGVTKTTLGAVTVGPGSIAVTGDATLAAGKTIDGTAGIVKLPLQPYINNAQLSASATAANLNTLVTGGDATSLHTHGTAAAAGLTLWGSALAGQIGYMTGTAKTLAKAKADALSTSRFYGVYAGTAGSVATSGVVPVLFDAGLNSGTAPASGQPVFISDATAGQATNVAPTTKDHVAAQIGIIEDATGYDNGLGAALRVLLQPLGVCVRG